MNSIYLIGSLKNREGVQAVAKELRQENYDVFDDWLAPGPDADDQWKLYEEARGRTYQEALQGYAAKHIFEFDKKHLDRCEIAVLVMPAGKSAHLELSYMLQQGKPGYILMDRPDRWEVMVQFATGIAFNMGELMEMLRAGGSSNEK